MLDPWEKSHDKPKQNIKNQKHHFIDKSPYNQSYGFPIVLYGYESWTIKRAEGQKNWWFQTVEPEKIFKIPLNSKKIKPVNIKGNQSWIFIGRTDAEAPILWPPEEPAYWKRPWCLERLKARGEEGSRRWDGWMASPMSLRKLWEIVKDKEGWRAAIHRLQSVGHDLVTEQSRTQGISKSFFLWRP